MTIIDLDGERLSPRARLPETLGEFQGPEVAVRLKETEYRLGFSKEGQVNTSYHPMPRRISLSSEARVVTVRRGRSEGLPLVSKPSGQDALVEIATSASGLRSRTPFAPVPFFLHDFALLPQPPRPDAVLLLNEKADGSGKGYLLHQTAE
ncbi:MAG: hypothetical protein GWO11_01135 [Desulfuromonadales bacterium]|nr:hypothetical protein [Desulfuromonadales bacterium]NIS40596.1 hypothetical protein [Desulfuromonadales bacterium]